MENLEILRKIIRESIKSMDEGTNNCNAISLEDIQEQPAVGKIDEVTKEDQIKVLKEEREKLIELLEKNTPLGNDGGAC